MLVIGLLYLNFLLMLALPLLLARLLHLRFRPGWGLFGIGAATFVLSQVGHLPFNWVAQRTGWLPDSVETTGNLVITAVFFGLSAGVFEETARYLAYRFWAKDARTWKQGMMMGAGHGGIEAMLLGLLGLINTSILLGMRNGVMLEIVPVEQMALVEQQIAAIFGLPWYMTLLGAVERIFAICFHLSASLLVMQVFVRRQRRWLWLAVGWHTLLDATAVFAVVKWGALAAEGIIGVLAVISVGIIRWLWRVEPDEKEDGVVETPALSVAETAVMSPKEIEITPDMLDNSRYS
ncbi:MAG: YhfC family intramembrane metalloprotease [Anaerolineales bacterium]|nr:YhfC family intramembrane metalloprotease [Anaerolineales bacterium]